MYGKKNEYTYYKLVRVIRQPTGLMQLQSYTFQAQLILRQPFHFYTTTTSFDIFVYNSLEILDGHLTPFLLHTLRMINHNYGKKSFMPEDMIY